MINAIYFHIVGIMATSDQRVDGSEETKPNIIDDVLSSGITISVHGDHNK